MRGKDLVCFCKVCQLGITPAYAGKSCRQTRHNPPARDHPRLCGEKPDNEFDEEYFEGSPPPMRGKAADIVGMKVVLRITPAYAGKSVPCLWTVRGCGDHPRLCGEKPEHFSQCTNLKRITPAYAGKSNHVADVYRIEWDHPRLCGEKISHALLMMLDRGSPPPMRGKVPEDCRPPTEIRITPAYAGKRSKLLLHGNFRGDHPRLCGEKLLLYVPLPAGIGSPPPMRGKALKIIPKQKHYRITPAYAGKSNSSDTRLNMN